MSLFVVARKADAAPPQSKSSSTSLRISDPNDALEQEADRIAGEVMSGGRKPNWSISNLGVGQIQRQGAGSPDPTVQQPAVTAQDTSPTSIIGKLAEAFLQTDVGKKLKDAATSDPVVKGLTDFAGTLPGKVVVGAAATGTVAALAAAQAPLPIQPPAIPLDVIKPGLSVKIDYEGPVNHPTQATITFSYTPKGDGKKPKQTDSERYRAETARIAADQDKFRAGMRYAPGSPQDLQQKAEDQAVQGYVTNRLLALPGSGGPLSPLAPSPLDQQLGLKPLASQPDAAKKKEEQAPVQRKAENRAGNSHSSMSVDVLPRSGGRPLDAATRTFMESKFGYDFSKVRIHTGSEAAGSAKSVNALAYTVGQNLVFGAGQYAPNTLEGRKLIAHELTHTIQQGHALPARGVARGVPDPGAAPIRTVQRKCSCGGSAGPGDCEDCKQDEMLQRKADPAADKGPKAQFEGCDPKLQDDLQQKQGPALDHVNRAITTLSKGWKDMDPAAKATFNQYFDPGGTGDVDDGFVNDVKGNYQRIRSYMSSLTFDCDTTSKTICGSGQKWCAEPRLMWTCFGALHVCPDAYAKADESFKIETMIHESVHNALHTTDREYASDKGFSRLKPRGSGFLSFLSKIPIIGAFFRLFRSNNDTLYNPDSYARFAAEV